VTDTSQFEDRLKGTDFEFSEEMLEVTVDKTGNPELNAVAEAYWEDQ
jgi:hypothetical protein